MCDQKDQNELKWYNKSWFWFAVTCVIVLITTVGAFCWWHSTNATRQDEVFKVYNKNIENAHELLKGARSELLDSLRDNPDVLLSDYDTVERLTKIAEKLSEEHTAASLLEIEANKIQNQYEALGIWAGVITIVFLIFSFYNLFKSEELQKEGKQAVQEIKELKRKAEKNQSEISTFNQKANNKLSEIEINANQKLKNLEALITTNSEKINTNNQSITNFEARIKFLNTSVEEELQKIKSYSDEISKAQDKETSAIFKELESKIQDLKNQLDSLTAELLENREQSNIGVVTTDNVTPVYQSEESSADGIDIREQEHGDDAY